MYRVYYLMSFNRAASAAPGITDAKYTPSFAERPQPIYFTERRCKIADDDLISLPLPFYRKAFFQAEYFKP